VGAALCRDCDEEDLRLPAIEALSVLLRVPGCGESALSAVAAVLELAAHSAAAAAAAAVPLSQQQQQQQASTGILALSSQERSSLLALAVGYALGGPAAAPPGSATAGQLRLPQPQKFRMLLMDLGGLCRRTKSKNDLLGFALG
jgi:hypothetical protein